MAGRAVVIGALVEHDLTHQADEGLVPAVLEFARTVAGRAAHAGPLVPPFFRSLRAVSMALAPILWTRSRTSNSVLPRSLSIGLGGQQLGDSRGSRLGGRLPSGFGRSDRPGLAVQA